MGSFKERTIPWRLIRWTDANNKEVRSLVFHVDELKEVVDLPFPEGAACREPIYECSTLAGARFFRRDLTNIGDCFTEFINQGNRDCQVVAIDNKTWRVLYEYTMPNETSALRWYQWENGVMKTGQIAYSTLSKKWLDLIAQEGIGIDGLVGNPQSGKYAMKRNFEKHGYGAYVKHI